MAGVAGFWGLRCTLAPLRCTWVLARCARAPVRGARGLATTPALHVPRDVLLYRDDMRRYHLVMGLFGVSQMVCWLVMASLAFSDDWPVVGRINPLAPVNKWIDLSSKKRRNAMGVFCVALGSTALFYCIMGARRSVRKVVLCRGGQDLTFGIYHLFGLKSSFTVPVSHVSCMAHRISGSYSTPLKIKGRPFYFVLCNSGQIYNTKLFNLTVGTYRNL